MPRIVVKLFPGRTEEHKARLAEEIVNDVIAVAKCWKQSVSVAWKEINPEDWAEEVYKPDILTSPGEAAQEARV